MKALVRMITFQLNYETDGFRNRGLGSHGKKEKYNMYKSIVFGHVTYHCYQRVDAIPQSSQEKPHYIPNDASFPGLGISKVTLKYSL